jgi:hypothetical protein
MSAPVPRSAARARARPPYGEHGALDDRTLRIADLDALAGHPPPSAIFEALQRVDELIRNRLTAENSDYPAQGRLYPPRRGVLPRKTSKIEIHGHHGFALVFVKRCSTK